MLSTPSERGTYPLSKTGTMTILDEVHTIFENEFYDAVKEMLRYLVQDIRSEMLLKLSTARVADPNALPAKLHEALSQPCSDPSYAKAFKRLTGQQLTMYDVVSYNDVDAILSSENGRRALGAGVLYDAEDLEVTDKQKVLPLMRRVCVACRGLALPAALPAVPTRAEIAANIKDNRKQRGNVVSAGATAPGASKVREARVECVRDAVTTLGGNAKAVTEQLLAQIDTDLRAGGASAVQKHDYAAVMGIASMKCLQLPPPSDKNETAWKSFCDNVHRTHSLGEMTKAIPAGMMQTIESQAMALAGGVQNGSIDMKDLDLTSIGKNVMESCSADDMQNLAGNIDEVLPNLSALAASMQSSGGPALPADMQSLLHTVNAAKKL